LVIGWKLQLFDVVLKRPSHYEYLNIYDTTLLGDEGNVKSEIPALLRVKMWLGLEADEKDWYAKTPEAQLSIFAETYENQVYIAGSQTS
jgi:hypothetical protein